jgi:hypothetical protein
VQFPDHAAILAQRVVGRAASHSLCADDASDAYQRDREIFLRIAGRVDAATRTHGAPRGPHRGGASSPYRAIGQSRFQARRRVGESVDMNTEDAMDDITLLLIAKKAGYGLAQHKWRAALEQIRALPERAV